MILQGEAAILTAARDRLRLGIDDGGAGYSDRECDVELDEMVPAIAGKRYVAVMPGGFTPGDLHNRSGGVFDLIYSISVLVVCRINYAPRDKTRDVFLGNLANLSGECDRIIEALDFNYETNDIANGLIKTAGGADVSFIKPLVFSGLSAKPVKADADLFGGSDNSKAGMMRTIFFTGARLITNR